MSNDKLAKASQNPLIRGSLSLAEEASSIIPGLGLPPKMIKIFMREIYLNAQEAMCEEISAGDVEILSDPEKQYLMPIGYKFYEAARSGTTTFNLKILAKIIKGMITSRDISVQKYSIIERAVKDLDAQSLVVLGGYMKYLNQHQLPKIGKNDWSIDDTKKVTQMDEWVHKFSIQIDQQYESMESYLSAKSILSSFGIVIPVFLTLDKSNLYYPTNLLLEIKKYINENDLIKAAQ